jgi:acyl-coenzyme A thioesterase PaaI-like protein
VGGPLHKASYSESTLKETWHLRALYVGHGRGPTLLFGRPSVMRQTLEARGRIVEVKPRKVVVDIKVTAGGAICARGNVVGVLMPESTLPHEAGPAAK